MPLKKANAPLAVSQELSIMVPQLGVGLMGSSPLHDGNADWCDLV